ncbi:MAG: hypothetical protein RIT81_35330 [Deltaproteobacteria bacterium]
MTAALLDLNQRVNRIFGVCVDVQNSARPLLELAFQMRLLARNGVVHAAKLGREEGGSLSVLTQFLSELPNEIQPIVEQIDAKCRDVAEAVSRCTHVIRVYSLEVQALLEIAKRHDVAAIDRRFVSTKDLVALSAEMSRASLTVTERRAVSTVGARVRPNLAEVVHLTQEAGTKIDEVRELLLDLCSIVRTGRYISQCVRVEVARIHDDADRFVSFGDRVANTVDVLEERLQKLGRIASDGQRLLAALERGVEVDEK